MLVIRRVVIAIALLLSARDARGLTVLTAGKQALVTPARTIFRFSHDAALASVEAPTCPATSSVQIASSNAFPAPVALPCEKWKRRGGAYRYRDRTGAAGGVRDIVLGKGRLRIAVRGTTVTGPVGYVEVWLNVGDARYMGRFHNFRRNDGRAIVTRRPSRAAADGEAAFFATLLGDADRVDTAQASLERAIAHDPKDGRSHFLLGMLHLLRAGRELSDYAHASEVARDESALASRALDAAVPLLLDDTRVPGFRAAATYVDGVVHGDPIRRDLGLAQLRDAFALNPLFNLFDFVGVVPPTVPRTDPLYAEAMAYLSQSLATIGEACAGRDEVCGNVGLAPHNQGGTFLLFGDLFAKAGVLAGTGLDNARSFYRLAATLEGPAWRFRGLAQARLATAADRVAAYQDADPANDPGIVGSGAEACATCHYR